MINELLKEAIKANDIVAVEKLLANLDISKIDSADSSLSYAALYNRKEIIKLLLGKGFNVNASDSNNCSALSNAASDCSPEIIELLLEHGADINHKDKNGYTPLMLAVMSEKMENVELLLKHKADTNLSDSENNTPLIFAAEHGYEYIVETLINNGADVDHLGRFGETAISLAAKYGHVGIVKRLLEVGAGRKEQDIGDSRYIDLALRYASLFNEIETMLVLLSHGANVDAEDEDGKTALILATEKQVEDVEEDEMGAEEVEEEEMEVEDAENDQIYLKEAVFTLLRLAEHDLDIGNTKNILRASLDKAMQENNRTLFAEIMSKQFSNLEEVDEETKNEFSEYFLNAAVLFNHDGYMYFSMYKTLKNKEAKRDDNELLSELSSYTSDLKKTITGLPDELYFETMSYIINDPIADDAKKVAKKAFDSYKNKDTNNKRPKNTI